jgi:hypothetical protein
MAKKTTRSKSTSGEAAKKSNVPSDAVPEICKLKHDVIDKELLEIKRDEDRRHEELKKMIGSLQDTIKEDVKESHSSLKDKIVLTEKTIGEKLDKLSIFDDTLKGNGTPGVWESIRSLNKSVKIIMSILIIIVIFELGGSWSKINWESLRERIWGSPDTKQVEPVKEEVKTVEEKKVEKKEIKPLEEKKEETNEPERSK